MGRCGLLDCADYLKFILFKKKRADNGTINTVIIFKAFFLKFK
jgi:hypothetical protein